MHDRCIYNSPIAVGDILQSDKATRPENPSQSSASVEAEPKKGMSKMVQESKRMNEKIPTPIGDEG